MPRKTTKTAKIAPKTKATWQADEAGRLTPAPRKTATKSAPTKSTKKATKATAKTPRTSKYADLMQQVLKALKAAANGKPIREKDGSVWRQTDLKKVNEQFADDLTTCRRCRQLLTLKGLYRSGNRSSNGFVRVK